MENRNNTDFNLILKMIADKVISVDEANYLMNTWSRTEDRAHARQEDENKHH